MFREVMQHSGLVGYAEAGILIFFGSFMMILALAFFGMSRDERREAVQMPLNDDEIA